MNIEIWWNFYILNFFSDYTIHIQKIVLDPRLKLEYYITHKWESEWIEEAKTAIYTTYNEIYAPLPGSGSGSGSGSVYRKRSNIADTEISDISTTLQ